MLNPITIFRESGSEFLKQQLNKLEVVDLKNICKEYTPDITRKMYNTKDKNKIIDYIIYHTESLANKGIVFYE